MLSSWSYVIGITGSGVPAATQMTGYRANLTAQPLGGDRRGLGVGIEGLDVGVQRQIGWTPTGFGRAVHIR